MGFYNSLIYLNKVRDTNKVQQYISCLIYTEHYWFAFWIVVAIVFFCLENYHLNAPNIYWLYSLRSFHILYKDSKMGRWWLTILTHKAFHWYIRINRNSKKGNQNLPRKHKSRKHQNRKHKNRKNLNQKLKRKRQNSPLKRNLHRKWVLNAH